MLETISFPTAQVRGITVLGKVDGDGVVPVVFANRTQADSKAQALNAHSTIAAAIQSPMSNRFLVKILPTGDPDDE